VVALFLFLTPHAFAQEQECGNIGSITANDYSDGNYPHYAFDNNTQTRWENPGRGSWIKYKFEYNVLFTSADVLWHSGDQKVYSFRIQAADNATADFQTIFSANSSSSTTEFERYDFNDTLADRIKIQVYGNDVDNISSITEIRLDVSVNGSNPLNVSSLKVPEHIMPSKSLPSAEQVWHNETFYVPSNVSNFVLLIPNEGHHATLEEQLSPKNGIYLPTHIIMSQNTALSVLNDDNGHCHTTWVTSLEDGTILAKTEAIPAGAATNQTIRFNSTGMFKISDPSEPVMQSTFFVYGTTEQHAGNMTAGAIYVPQEDLAEYKKMFADANFRIESEYDFEWNNTNNEVKRHTLLIYSTTDPLGNALGELSNIAEKTPYT